MTLTVQRHFKPALAVALRETLAEGYTYGRFRKDLSAAFVVSLVALPLSMALAIAVGLPPQHGLYTAIVAGVLTPLLGGSRMQVSGPTAAFVVILAPIVSQYGLFGLIWCQILAGLLLLVLGFFRLGRFIEHVPDAVTTGFTAGIAVILGVISLNDLFGMGLDMSHGHFPEKVNLLARHAGDINPYAAATGFVTLLLIVYGGRIVRFVPAAILAVGAGIGLSMLFAQLGHPVATIASQFQYVLPDGVSGAGIPPFPPHFDMPETPESWVPYLYPAVVIALLAALESLLAAQVADKMTGHKHHPNAELYGIGAGNIASGLFGGIPATGAIARTATLINNGATSPIASSMHALFILMYVVLLAPLIGHIPMTALAAILVHTAWRMSHAPHFWRILRGHGYHKAGVLLATFGMTVAVDMVAGVATGLILHFVFVFATRNKPHRRSTG